jgi:hypothetical protein
MLFLESSEKAILQGFHFKGAKDKKTKAEEQRTWLLGVTSVCS